MFKKMLYRWEIVIVITCKKVESYQSNDYRMDQMKVAKKNQL